MKKSLVLTLALVFVLGIAGTAFAANPFVDVPANHWAYASIAKLADTGIIDGYGDGTFVGNRTMTRYEMAQIVAKAMARVDKADAAAKAQIEKLAAEFANELDSLGVRVAKLEKNADNVKITGEFRIGNWSFSDHRPNKEQLRTRLFVAGQVNDNWRYYGMIEEQTANLRTNYRESTFELRRAAVEGTIGAIGVQAGRFAYTTMYGTVMGNETDGINLKYNSGNFKSNLAWGRPSLANDGWATYRTARIEMINLALGYNISEKFDVSAAYYFVDDKANNRDTDIWELGAGYRFDKNWRIWANYVRGGDELADGGGQNGWAARLDYGGVKRDKPGSFGIFAAYYDIPGSATIDTVHEHDIGTIGAFGPYDGYKGLYAGVNYMVAKNIQFNVEYFDWDSQEEINSSNDDSLLWTYVTFYF